MTVKVLESISDLPRAHWDRLFGAVRNPFVRHDFLRGLEETGCIGEGTGWRPRHLVLEREGVAVAALPLYRKQHSYGEFVFDWGWAQAYARHGLDYYPKLVSAVPFTPSTGPRLGLAPGEEPEPLVESLLTSLQELAAEEDCSSWHLLFPDAGTEQMLEAAPIPGGLLQRQDVQFHWRNRGYESFDDFLGRFKASRRKNLKRERRRVAEQGVVLERIDGGDITDAQWAAFYACYVDTYLKRSGHTGYLTRGFFERLRESMADQLLLVAASRDQRIVASALFFHDRHALYGRYWGALEEIRCLHFEACFYQGIEFCIDRGLARFDPGTQGEHKLLRGFEPTTTRSLHWIADSRFRVAIGDFLTQERRASERYGEQAADYLPFRRDQAGAEQGKG